MRSSSVPLFLRKLIGRKPPDIELPDDPTREEIRQIIEQLFSDAETENYTNLKRLSGRLRREARRTRSGFEKRLWDRWGAAIDLYDLFLIFARQMGEDFNRENRTEAETEQDFVFLSLTRIHARACLIASEVRALMVSGHASGALARWRSLHELAVVASFIEVHGIEVAERYILHTAIRTAKEAERYEKHYEAMGYDPLEPTALDRTRASRDALLARYGDAYKKDYGWAAGLLAGNPTFERIEKAAGLAHHRPHFDMASNSVHAGFKGMAFDIGHSVPGHSRQFLLAGPSNAGLADPGHAAAISLMQCTVVLAKYKPTPESAIWVKMLLRLCDEVGEAFLSAHNQLLTDAARYDPRAGDS